MPRILVPPEVLIRVSEEAARAAEELETTKNRLDQQITYMMSSWEGTTRSRFFEDFQHAHGEMKKTIEHLRIIGQELKGIAFRFISADMHEDLMIAAAAASGANEPKTFWDHAGDFWQGLQTGAKSVANSVKDTATSLVEDPLDTAKDMAYNMTIGTIEEAAETVVWGGKMIFDADTQDKFAADVEASGGAFNFAGQQAAMAIAGLTTRRLGVKTHPNLKNDSGGDGGKVEGTPNAPDSKGKFIGNVNELKPAERRVANDLIAEGKTVERIPESTKHGEKTPDFKVDGVLTELKSLQNPNVNTGVGRIKDGFKQLAEKVIIDGREAGLTKEQAQQILERAKGTYPDQQIPGEVEIWINNGKVTN